MISVVSVENMRASDQATIENGISGAELMRRAAQGIYEAVESERGWDKTLIVCGAGNNAGDGFALASIMHDKENDCALLLLSDRFSADGEYYYKQCVQKGIKTIDVNDDFSKYKIIVDCIFGTGFHSEVKEPYKSVIEKINGLGAYVVSADINSGLNGQSGMYEKTSVCIKSDLTVSIGDYKPGLFLADAKDVISKKVNCDIGIKLTKEPYKLLEKSDVANAFAPRLHNSHKGTYGYIALIGGCVKYSGAIRLANMAQSAMKSGAGVVKLAVPSGICPAVMPHLLESTLFPLSDNNGEILFVENEFNDLTSGVHTVAVGMGIGQSVETYKVVEYLLKNYKGNLIIDADGLNVLASNMKLLNGASPQNIVLTPHPKEFSRLSGLSVAQVLSDPCKVAKDFAKEFGVIVLLKGATSVITDGKEVFLSDRGCGGMATAGSGDVLSGIVAAMVSGCDKTLLATACASYIAGLAGELAGEKNMISMVASDTVNHINEAIIRILE